MSLNPEVSYTYNPAYHIKRGWRLQVIDTSAVTDFNAFRPGLTTTEQPNSDHVGTKVWIYVRAGAAAIVAGDTVSRPVGDATYMAVIKTPNNGQTAGIIGVAAHGIAANESGWIVQKGVVNAVEGVAYSQGESLVADAVTGRLTAGADSDVGVGVGIGADGVAGDSVEIYINCK